MAKTELRHIAEKEFCRLGAVETELTPSGRFFCLNGRYFKVTTLESFWVFEYAEKFSAASVGCFEDVDPTSYDISVRDVIKAVDELLKQ